MKLTKSNLKQLIKEEVYLMMGALDHENNFIEKLQEDHGGEGSMARKQLARTAEIANMLQDSIMDDTNLEEWVESKITKAQDYLTSVLNYMRGSELVNAGNMCAELEEKKLTKPEENKKEEIVKGMKKNKSGFEERYGKDAESVMYATATKIAKEKA